MYVYVCVRIYEHKNVYVCLSKKKKEYICSLPFLSSVSLPLPGAVYVRAFQAVPSPQVRHSSSLNHGLGVIWFLLPYLAACLLQLFVSLSFLLSLPSPAS